MLSEYYTGKKIVISAGPTYEKIDPVRFIGNYSTGRMGYAIAEALADAGAEVHLVSGPVNISTENPAIRVYPVESAIEMYDACTRLFPECHMAIMAAAVADYRPEKTETAKIKKKSDELVLRLVKNPDILSALGQMKKEGQIVVGFALETNNEVANATEKLERKNADAIVLNSLNDPGAGFRFDTNKISIILKKGTIFEYPLKDKHLVAIDIITCISENLK